MALSAIGRAALVSREALKTRAYKDSVGVWTIGVGHAFGDPVVTPGMVITVDEALAIFDKDLLKYEAAVDCGVKVPLADHERDALVSICFNIGVGTANPKRGQKPGFLGSSFLKRLNAGDRAGCAKGIMAWTKPAEVSTRRTAERDQFLTPYSLALPKARSDDRAPVRVGAKPSAGKPKTDRMAVAPPAPAPAVIDAPRVETVAAPTRVEARAELPFWARWFVRKKPAAIDRPGLKPGGSETLYDAQVQLRARSYYTKMLPDGLDGPITQAAVAQARKDNGLGDGGVDEAFLAALPSMPNRLVPVEKATASLGQAAKQLPEVFNPLKWIAGAAVTSVVGGTADGTGLLDQLQSTAARVNDVTGSVQSAIGTVSGIVGFMAEHRSLLLVAGGVVALVYVANKALDAWIKVRTAFF